MFPGSQNVAAVVSNRSTVLDDLTAAMEARQRTKVGRVPSSKPRRRRQPRSLSPTRHVPGTRFPSQLREHPAANIDELPYGNRGNGSPASVEDEVPVSPSLTPIFGLPGGISDIDNDTESNADSPVGGPGALFDDDLSVEDMVMDWLLLCGCVGPLKLTHAICLFSGHASPSSP